MPATRRDDDTDRDEADAFVRDLGGEDEPEAAAKPPLLAALEKILADPEEIRLDVQKLRVRLRRKHRGRALDRAVAGALVDRAARRTMLVGGATSLATVVPGLGSLAGAFGGAVADAALSLKYEVEMVQGIAWAHGRDLTLEEEQRACLILAGVGALAGASKAGALRLSTRAFVKVIDDLLAGNTGRILKVIFRLLGLRVGPRFAARLIPLGVGVSVGLLANRGLTRAIGARAIAWCEARRT